MMNKFQKQHPISKVLNQQEKLLIDEPLSKHTTFQIGGKAQYLVKVEDVSNLKDVLHLALENNLAYFIIGSGSNLLISEQGIGGIVVKLGKGFSKIEFDGNRIICGAGVKLADLVKVTSEHILTGTEFLYGIPGTFGGAIKNNAGAFSHSIGEIIESVSGIQINSGFEIHDLELNKDQLGFSYRSSQLPKDFIITAGIIKLSQGKREAIRTEIERIKQFRKDAQPWGSSAGSIFKNPKGMAAGKLIDEAGLKGLAIGGAYISNKHANFIINRGGARFNDVLELIQIMKMRVEARTGIILEEEVEIVSNE